MSAATSPNEYLVISRGHWDSNLPPERIQKAIDDFYVWLDQCVAEGKMKPGQRLGNEGRLISKQGTLTDGPFIESKEVVGGFWFILAKTLDEAAQIAAANPCMQCGLYYEIRPLALEKASAFTVTNETARQPV